MKTETKIALFTIALAFAITALTGCSTTHERTEIDRELVLKLADRPQVVVTPSAPVNVNNYNGGQSQQPMQVSQQPQQQSQNCTKTPIYHLNGSYAYTDVQCW